MLLALSATNLFGGSMVLGVHVHIMLLRHLCDLVRNPIWLACLLVRCHLYLCGL